jgi:alanine racemase
VSNGQLGPSPHRSAWLEIDLAAIRHNVAIVRALVGPAAVAAVVKADAYGHGLGRVARALSGVVDALCVATLDEAVAVRAQTGARVILLYPAPASAAADAVAARVELTIMSATDLQNLQRVGRADRSPVDLQLCVETGLGRGGLPLEEVVAVAVAAEADPRFRLAGLWSHLASPEDLDATARQVERFEVVGEALQLAGVPMPARHLAASSAIFRKATSPLELVRPGLALYGVLDADLSLAGEGQKAAARLRPAMSLKARPVAISDIPAGAGVGYGGHWRAQRPSRVAILPVGYADGYLRDAQPGASALVRGTRVPLVGVISMDALAVDITDLPGLDHSDEYVLLGRQGEAAISAAELARARNTIPWEVLSCMAARLDRVYYPEAGPAPPGRVTGAVPDMRRPLA